MTVSFTCDNDTNSQTSSKIFGNLSGRPPSCRRFSFFEAGVSSHSPYTIGIEATQENSSAGRESAGVARKTPCPETGCRVPGKHWTINT